MNVNLTIFREYDIRGVAGVEFLEKAVREYEKWYGQFRGVTITLDVASAIGKAYGTIIRRLGGREVVVGHEIRPYADELTHAFIEGVRNTGCNVTDLGVSLTPLVYFATAYKKFDGGVNVTGSHNVYFYNGFKLMKKDVWPIFGDELQDMRKIIEREDFFQDKKGAYSKDDDIYKIYKEYVQEQIQLRKKVRIVVDCGNGSAGVFAPDFFRSLGCEVIELYTEPDATFPNHVPDPEQRQYMVDLGKRVVDVSADFGIGIDADGDRVGFVNEKGEFIDGDLINLVFAKDALSRFPGKKILFDVKCSRLLQELVPQWGGIPLMHRTGHGPIKETLRKNDDVIFAGELSGHFYFVENYFKFDDALYSSARLLDLFSRANRAFSSLFLEFPERVRTPEFKLPCEDEKKFAIVAEIQKNLSSKYSSVTIDGVRFQVSEKGWGIVRASNTSPYLTVRVEAETEEEVLQIKNILADELEKFSEIGDKLDRQEIYTLTGRLGWV